MHLVITFMNVSWAIILMWIAQDPTDDTWLDATSPLSEPMLTRICVNIWCHKAILI